MPCSSLALKTEVGLKRQIFISLEPLGQVTAGERETERAWTAQIHFNGLLVPLSEGLLIA